MNKLVAISALVFLSTLTGCASMDPAHSSEPTLLFVQSAQGVESSPGSLTLKGVSPTTIYFTDRPRREAGHSTTADFVAQWSEGNDSFAKDPPNATLSVLAGNEVENVVVTLSNPRLDGNDLTYDVRTLEGTLPRAGGGAALFIDVVVVRRAPVVVVPRRRAVVVR